MPFATSSVRGGAIDSVQANYSPEAAVAAAHAQLFRSNDSAPGGSMRDRIALVVQQQQLLHFHRRPAGGTRSCWRVPACL